MRGLWLYAIVVRSLSPKLTKVRGSKTRLNITQDQHNHFKNNNNVVVTYETHIGINKHVYSNWVFLLRVIIECEMNGFWFEEKV
jgi:hypothetical protein